MLIWVIERLVFSILLERRGYFIVISMGFGWFELFLDCINFFDKNNYV